MPQSFLPPLNTEWSVQQVESSYSIENYAKQEESTQEADWRDSHTPAKI